MESSLPPKDRTLKTVIAVLLALIAAGLALMIGVGYRNSAQDAPLVAESTLGELALWMADQSAEDAPPSLLGRWAQVSVGGAASAATLTDLMQTLVLVWCSVTAACIIGGMVGLATRARWTRQALLVGLIGMDVLLFLIPTVDGEQTLLWVLVAIGLMLALLVIAQGKVSRVIGFMIAVSTLLVIWEAAKAFAASVNYAVTVPQPAWEYTTYATLEDGLAALSAGNIDAIFADRNALEDLMPADPSADSPTEGLPYPDLRYVDRLARTERLLIFSLQPEFPGRLSVAVRADDAGLYSQPAQFMGRAVGAVAGDFALESYLAVERRLVIADLKILNDLNLPHLESIANAFLQPARRNGDFLLIRILGEAGLYTLREAALGFAFGVILGLVLGTVFAHSKLLERALLPYVVASQTVPILAIAPMVVIWLGASFTSVAVIAAYITFFPVAINTLRGLQSPAPTQLELMQSYAAHWWTILWKLRFPAALPFIFTALKVSATASVVGAIIGELPSGMSGGLGRAILNFSSDYSLTSTPKLWAAIVTAAVAGIAFFVVINLTEQFVLRRYARSES